MPDQEKSTTQPPKRPEYNPAFRQTFLWRASRQEDAETLLSGTPLRGSPLHPVQ